MGAAIIFGIISVIAFLRLLIPIGRVGALAVLGGKAAGWDWRVMIVTGAVVFGCVALGLLIFAMALISVPVAVFFPGLCDLFFRAAVFAPGSMMEAADRACGCCAAGDARLAAWSAQLDVRCESGALAPGFLRCGSVAARVFAALLASRTDD